MAKISLFPIDKFNSSGGYSISTYQTACKLEILNSAGSAVLQTQLWPIGSSSIEVEIDPGQYIFKLTVLDTITAGQMSMALLDDVAGQPLWNTGLVITNSNKVVTSQLINISNAFNRVQLIQSSGFASTATAAAFDVTFALGACSGAGPVVRRANFTFANYTTPVQISTDNINWTIINPNGFYREAPVDTTVTYYFKHAGAGTKTVPVTFTACAAAPPAAPTLNKTSMTTAETVQVTWLGGNGSLKVYSGNSVVATVTSGASPNNFSFASLGPGTYTFTVTNANGESAKSAEIFVNAADSGGGTGICGFSHLSSLFTWNEPTEGPFDFKAIKFSNSGSLPWVGQIVSLVPLKFILRSPLMLTRTDITFALGVSASSASCLAGGPTAEGGLLEPAGFPMPPGYEKVGNVYQPKATTETTNVEVDIEVDVEQYCSATPETVQIGITEEYGAAAPAADKVTKWVDGTKTKVLRKNGVYPWICIRDKNNPTKVSAFTNILLV